MFCQCVHAPRSAEILSHAVFLVLSEVWCIRPLSPSLYLSVLSLCRCGRTDCCSVTSTALAFQQRRIRWKFHISLSLSGMWHIQFLYTWHWWYSFSLFFSISPSHSVCLSVSQPCLTFPALIGRGKFYRVWQLVWRVRTYRYTSIFIFAFFFSIKSIYLKQAKTWEAKLCANIRFDFREYLVLTLFF